MPYSIGETLKSLADDPYFKEFMQGTQDIMRGAGAAIASSPVETVRAPYSIAESMYKGYFGRDPQISTENTPGGFQDIRQRMGGQESQTKAETAGSVLGSFADPIYGGAKILGAAASTIPLMSAFKGAGRELGPMQRQAGTIGSLSKDLLRDEKGKLKTLYHGTPNGGFTSLKKSGKGIFFTDSPTVAGQYTYKRGPWLSQGKSPAIYPSHLSMKKPLIIDALGKRHDNIPVPWKEWKPKVFGNLPEGAVSVEDALEYAEKNGYDGLIVKNVVDAASHDQTGKSTVYAVISPEQVLSSFNSP